MRPINHGGASEPLLSRRLLASVLFAAAAPAVAAPALPRPTQSPILTVSGKIGVFNEGNTARFDRPMLEAIGMASFTTTTPWYDGPVTFEGPPMAKVMSTVAASGDTVTAVALNDYVTEIPMHDFTRYGVLLALKRDGAYMPVRDKGPLFIVYPYDSNPDLRHRRFYSRSAWQLTKIIVS
jgi:hypothetical protein